MSNFLQKIKDFFKYFKSYGIIYPVTVMVAICLVVTAALAGTNLLTKAKIAKITKDNSDKAMAELIKADKYETAKVEYEGSAYEYTVAYENENALGYIFNLTEKGYGGQVNVMIAIATDGTVMSAKVLDVSNETPGLGQNTAKDAFINQFKGKAGILTAKKYGTASGESEIDAVASATITSTAVTKCVNKAIALGGLIVGETEGGGY